MTIISYDVPVLDDPTSSEFEDLVRNGRPVVLRGPTSGWPAIENWTLEYLRKTAGHRTVPIEFYPDGSWYGNWTTAQLRLDRYIDLLESPGDPEMCYLAQAKVDECLPELIDDIPAPAMVPEGAGAGIFLGRDSVTACHYHSRDEALLCQIGGRKKVTLYAPEDYRNLSYAHPFSYRYNFSDIDFSDEQRPAGPLRRAQPYECVLEAGDCLFIPLYWSHLTENQDLSMSVTFFWRSDNTWSSVPLAVRSQVGFWFRSQVSSRIVSGVHKVLGYP